MANDVQVGPYHANRHSYVVPELIDADVTMAQARSRLEKEGATTVVHFHGSQQSCIDTEGHRHELVGDCKVDEIATELNTPDV